MYLHWPQNPTLWNIDILLHKQATLDKHFCPECTYYALKNCKTTQRIFGKWSMISKTH